MSTVQRYTFLKWIIDTVGWNVDFSGAWFCFSVAAKHCIICCTFISLLFRATKLTWCHHWWLQFSCQYTKWAHIKGAAYLRSSFSEKRTPAYRSRLNGFDVYEWVGLMYSISHCIEINITKHKIFRLNFNVLRVVVKCNESLVLFHYAVVLKMEIGLQVAFLGTLLFWVQ